MNTRRNKQRRIASGGLWFVVLSAGLGIESNAWGADKTRSVNGDVFVVDARASTYLRMFQRALMPGPAGAIVTNDRLTLVYEDVALRVQGLDNPISEPNSVDFELAAWGGYTVGSSGYERALDGDLSVANVSQRIGNGYLRLGRQIYTGGASRFAQFDGVTGGVKTMGSWGQIGIDVYGGATVLPRWSSRAGYYQLGSATDTLLRYPESLPKPERAGTWQSGARAYGTWLQYGAIGVGFHEQRENGLLFARKVGVDATVRPLSLASLSAQSVFDVDGQSVADSRVWLDVYPWAHWSFGLEYLRTNPALFLSKQSVLNVFASDPFSEVGGDVDYRPNRTFSLSFAAYVDRFDTSGFGSRMQGRTQITQGNITLQFALGRVADPRNGYFSSRESLRWLLSQTYAITFDHYVYFYDRSIAGLRVSSVEAATGEWQVSSATRVAINGSLIQSPYTVLDLQGLCRLTVDLGRKPNRSPR